MGTVYRTRLGGLRGSNPHDKTRVFGTDKHRAAAIADWVRDPAEVVSPATATTAFTQRLPGQNTFVQCHAFASCMLHATSFKF